LYGEQLSASLLDAVEQHPRVAEQIEEVAAKKGTEGLQQLVPTARRIVTELETATQGSAPGSVPGSAPGSTTGSDAERIIASDSGSETLSLPQMPARLEPTAVNEPALGIEPQSTPAPRIQTTPSTQHNLQQRWADYASRANELSPSGDFPWRACFQRSAAAYDIPETLLLAIASGESNFDPAARSDKDAVGLMQVRWPGTSRHLGIVREADLYDPCTNVDAGARYLVQLADQYDHNYHLMVAAYNYGPSRISAGQVPAGAAWYSQYIFQHLQQVLGEDHIPTSELIERPAPPDAGQQVLMTFNQSYRARDYIAFLRAQLPELNLQQQSEALGHHDVVLLYQNQTERRRALRLIDDAGIATLNPQSQTKLYL
jgi:hypothetical protein